MPSASGSTTRRVVELARQAGVDCRILPGVTQVLSGEAQLAGIRRVEVEDLLRREPVELELPAESYVTGGTVLVTGAGGSIGSELVRQVARLDPRKVILYGHGENTLYDIQQELRGSLPSAGLPRGDRRHPRPREDRRDHGALPARRGLPRRRAQARPADGGRPRRGRAEQRGRHAEPRRGRPRGGCHAVRERLHGQGRAARVHAGRHQVPRGARGARGGRRARSPARPSSPCASATSWAAAARWCPSSRSRSARAARCSSPTPR